MKILCNLVHDVVTYVLEKELGEEFFHYED
jgi:hypothetical protein